MNKYSVLILLGLFGGFLGEKIGTQSIHFISKEFPMNLLFAIVISFVPFLVISWYLVFGLKGYTSFLKGLIYSFAYYVPFQYKAIWGNLNQNILPSETVWGRGLVTVAGALFLSGIYYLFLKWRNRFKRGQT
jgi:ABC-type branched-subunit amino acid transport system permease subunit